jgi:hypothetical protein
MIQFKTSSKASCNLPSRTIQTTPKQLPVLEIDVNKELERVYELT